MSNAFFNTKMFTLSAASLWATEVAACTEEVLDMFIIGFQVGSHRFFYRRETVELEPTTHCRKCHNPKPTPPYINPDMAPALMSVVDGMEENGPSARNAELESYRR